MLKFYGLLVLIASTKKINRFKRGRYAIALFFNLLELYECGISQPFILFKGNTNFIVKKQFTFLYACIYIYIYVLFLFVLDVC